MAIYTPRQVPPRPGKGGGKPNRFAALFKALFRRQQKSAPFRTPTMVTGAQRAWKLKRFSKYTLLFAVVGCALVAVLYLSVQLLVKSNIFRLTDIRISGTSHTTERQILDLVGLQQGGSLLRFNAKEAKNRIEAHPWVEQVEIKTQWPSAIEIVVSEFQPFALVNVEEGKEKRLRYVNRTGHVFADVGQGQELDFPVITGALTPRDVEKGNLVKGSLAEGACNVLLLAAKGNAILPIQAVSEMHLDQQLGLILYLVDHPFPVYFGKDRLQTKYFRLVRVLEQLYAKKQVEAVKEIRMDYLDDKVLVTGAQIDG